MGFGNGWAGLLEAEREGRGGFPFSLPLPSSSPSPFSVPASPSSVYHKHLFFLTINKPMGKISIKNAITRYPMHLDIFKLNMMMSWVFHTAHGYHATKILTNSDCFTQLNETGGPR